MMPKGVEHPVELARAGWRLLVKIPMMPKGVEHMNAGDAEVTDVSGEDSYDAERR